MFLFFDKSAKFCTYCLTFEIRLFSKLKGFLSFLKNMLASNLLLTVLTTYIKLK